MHRYAMRKQNHSIGVAESAELLDKHGVAAMCTLSPRTIAAMTARGDLPHIRLSKRCIRYPKKAVLEAMIARTIGMK